MDKHKISDLARLKSHDKWACQICSFDNSTFLDACEMCEAKKPKELIQPLFPQIKPLSYQTIICPNLKCLTQNDINQIKCKKCQKFFVQELNEDDEEQEKASQKKLETQLIKCHKCSFQNDPTNGYCLNCEAKIKLKHVLRKPKIKAPRSRKGPNYCEDCNTYKFYQANGQFQCKCPDLDDGIPLQKNFCNFCFKKLQKEKYDQHIQNCDQKLVFYDPNKNKSFQRMSKLQVDTIIYMHNKSMKMHFQRQKKLENRIQKLGFKKEQLQNLYHYIVNYAPIIIHMHANTHMEFFVKDTHYRCQFQTSKSSGSLSRNARTGWEDRMFDSLHHNAKDFQRVKYGTMNFTNDPHGVNACAGYGQSYFLLKQHVRDRCTMTDMDSSSPNSTICTFRFCYHLLCKLSDAEIKAAFEGSKAQQIKSNVIGMYKEIQIHGPVQFKKDIQRVYVSQAQLDQNPNALTLIKQFCKKNDLEYEIFQKPVVSVGFPFGGIPAGGIGIPPASSVVLPGAGGFGFGGFGFGGFPLVSHAYVPPRGPPIRFPYSMPPRKQQKQGEDYI